MFSIVIPTLWKSFRIHKLLSNLIECDNVGEIILIDNSSEFFNYYESLDKVKLIQPPENLYVNPSWNLGIEVSQNNCIALLNDDINFNPTIFEAINEDILKQVGIIGMGQGNYELKEFPSEPYLQLWESGMNDGGWGCFIMLHKTHWINIPDEIKIWYGDNFIKDVNPNPKAVLRNFPVDSEMSTTSDEKVWDEVKNQDLKYWLKVYNNKNEYRKITS
jgi:GT2 family glycosyltransferase